MAKIDPLNLFTECTGLTPDIRPSSKGTCETCGRVGLAVYFTRSVNRCAACYMIRKAYPLKNQKFTLGTGDYAVVSRSSTVFYTSLTLPRSSIIHTQPALKGTGFYELILGLMAAPPRPPWLLVHFGKPTETRNFRLNLKSRPDIIQVSGDTLFGGRNIATVKVWMVQRLQKLYPAVTAPAWRKLIASGSELYSMRDDDTAANAAEVRRTFGAEHPGIFDVLPELGTVEHRVLEVAIENEGSNVRTPVYPPRARR
jgi:hypothetical protein